MPHEAICSRQHPLSFNKRSKTQPTPFDRNPDAVLELDEDCKPVSLNRVTFRIFVRFVEGLLVCIAIAGSTQAVAADVYNFQHYGIDQELPQSQVRVIHQDPAGYLWVGTQGGLGRYNGREFKRYTSADGLAGNHIGALENDHSGRLWVGTNVGLCRRRDGSFECVDSELLRGRSIQALLAYDDGLLVGTERGLVRLSPKNLDVVDVRLQGQSILTLAPGKSGEVLVGTGSGLGRLDLATGGFEAIDIRAGGEPQVTALLPDGQRIWIGTDAGLFLRVADGSVLEMNRDGMPLSITNVSGLVQVPDGGLIFGTYRGLYRIEPGNHYRITRIDGLDNDIVRSVFRDREGIVWIGTDTGMNKLAPAQFLGYTSANGLMADFVRTIAEDGRGRLWLGTRIGVQVVPVRDGKLALKDSFTLTRDDGLPNDRIYAIEFPPQGGALLATNGGVVHWREDRGVVEIYTVEDGLPSNHVRSVLRDSQDRIWIGTASGVALLEGGKVTADLPAGLDGVYPFSIVEDESGRLWFATRDHGLLIVDPDGKVTRLGADQGFSDQTLWDLARAESDGMWVGTNGDGLFHIGADGGIRAQLTKRDGLADDFVWSVTVDANGHVWAYTTHGLSRYNGERFINYGKSDGLVHLEGGATGGLESSAENLWFASVGGLVRFASRDQPTSDVAPLAVIESAFADGVPIDPGARLSPDHFEITFEFAALTFHNENTTRYRYRLVGLNADWNELSSYRPITFARLGSGDYEFQVLAVNAAGNWSREPARFAFRVDTPLWLSPWFLALTVAAVAGIAVSTWRLRVRGLQRHAVTMETLVGERTRELKQANRRLHDVATTDPLTGLKNRRFLMDHIDHDIALCLRRHRRKSPPAEAAIGFLLIDLDGFKRINDTYGHRAGDTMLEQIGRVLLDVSRDSDYVIRWGGDEFLVVARHIDAEAGDRPAERIVEALRGTSFVIDESGQSVNCTCSLGVCTFPLTRETPEVMGWEQVVEIADAAAYLAKRDGGDNWVEILESGEGSIGDKAGFLREIREDAETLEASGRIRIRRGRTDSTT